MTLVPVAFLMALSINELRQFQTGSNKLETHLVPY